MPGERTSMAKRTAARKPFSSSNTGTSRRGRPPRPFHMDADRYAVAQMEMYLHASIKGKLPSARLAAERAAIGKEGKLLSASRSSEAPTRMMAHYGHRHSPSKPSLAKGYDELVFGNIAKVAGALALENCAQRLRRKHQQWMKGGTHDG